ncbi:hypothetical protein TWF506_003562 [Arthrobotrys conoides]|uniref:Clr5 domain-containing protein n=1 Tax=Arthrobotrys conoides TaxID=74498 RepID=A0AAN8NLF1_9PEZI
MPQPRAPAPVRAKPFPSREWKQYKNEILQLRQSYTVRDIREIMKEKYKFTATEAQYNNKFKTWDAKKNVPKAKLEEFVVEIEKRKAMGRKSVVEWKGNTFEEVDIMEKVSKKRPTTMERAYDRIRKQQTANTGYAAEPRDFVVSTPTEIGSTPLPQLLESPDSTETRLPDIDIIDLEVDQNVAPDINWSMYHAYVEDTTDVEFDILNQTMGMNTSTDFESGRDTHQPEIPKEEQEARKEQELQSLILTDLQRLPLTADTMRAADPRIDPMNAVVNYFQSSANLDNISWDAYARQKQRDYQEYINIRKQEAIRLIESATFIASSRNFGSDAMDQAWAVMERDLNYEPLPYSVCNQILEDRPVETSETQKTDSEWCSSMSKFLEKNFSQMKLYNENICPEDDYSIPTIVRNLEYGIGTDPSSVFEFNTFDSVAIHLPRFISEFGMWHFFTAFALQETARYLCFAQQRMEPHTLSPDMPGHNQPSPAQKYPAIARILTQAVITYESVGMGDHPIAIECLEMLLSNTDNFDDEDPIGGFLTTRVSGIPYRNYRRASKKYGNRHPRTISAYAQLISFSLKLLKSPKTRAQLRSGSQRVTLWGWNFEHSVEFAFHPCFDFFLTNLSGNETAETLEYPTQLPPNSKTRWQHIVRGNMFDILQTFEDTEKFENAIRLLKRMERWKNAESGWLEQDGFQMDLALGRIYGKMGAFKLSLQTLIGLARRANRPESRDWIWDAVREITVVTTKRGPVLYRCLQPFLQQLLDTWERSGRRRNYCYPTLKAIFSVNREERDSLLALRSLERVSYPTLQNQMRHRELDTPMLDIDSEAFEAVEYGVWEHCTLNPLL